MATYSTPYKSGTFDGTLSSGATTFTVSGFTPASSDVGRLIIITSGSARLQHREITAVSGQDITVAHAWDTNPFIDTSSDQRATDVLPANGDAFAISYDADDLIASDAQMTLTNTRDLNITGPITLSGGAYIHFKNFNLEFDAGDLAINRGAGMIFGYYGYVAGQDGYVKDSCNLRDSAIDQNGWLGSNFGMLDIYGGNVRFNSTGSSQVFWRLYDPSSSPTNNQVRIIGVYFYGNIGMRVDGNRSILLATNVNSVSTTGVANPRSAVARVELTVLDSVQGGYVFTSEGATGRIVFKRLVNVTDRAIRCLGTNPSSLSVYEVIAKKSEVDLIPTFINVSGTKSNHLFRYGNLARPTYIDETGGAVSDNVKTRLYDSTSAFTQEQNINNGEFSELFVRHTDIPTVSGNRTLANGTQYAPYSLRSVSYGKQFSATVINAEDTFEAAIVMLEDSLITESSKATVDAYTELETPQKFYDYAVAWLEGNITNEEAFLVSRSGSTIDAGSYNVTIDATASSVFAFDGSTITIKATTFTGNITTTGTVTLSNGATVSGTIIDSTADSALVFSGIDSWIVYANATDQDANTNPLGSGTTGNYRFTYSASTTYYMRLTTGTDTLLKTVTPTGSGETLVDLTTAGLLTTVTATVTKIDTKLGFVPPIVFCDPSLATNGSGSGESPFNNISEAVTQAIAIGATEIDLESSTALTAAASGVNIKAVKESLSLGLNGQDISFSKLEKLLIYGACVTAGSQLVQCYIGYPGLGGVSGYRGLIQGFILKETLSLGGDTTIVNGGAEHGENNTIEVNAGNSLSMTQITGDITVAKVEADSMADINFSSGHLTIDSSCTGGTIRVRGNATVIDNSAGSTVKDETSLVNVLANTGLIPALL